MKVTINLFNDHTELTIHTKNENLIYRNTFETKEEAEAFFVGFREAQYIINGMVQSFPLGYQSNDNRK